MHTVLLVSRDRDSREIFRSILEHRGYVVVEAVDPLEVLEIARVVRLDLLIRDYPLLLPDGSSVAEALKSDPATASIPILTITSRVTESELTAAKLDHSVRVLTKPIHPTLVVRHVQELIGAYSSPRDG
jgi:CheY-like chemotaxis protein